MTNPNPVAPKTDTPATQESSEMNPQEWNDPYEGHEDEQMQPKMVDDPVNGLARMRIVQAAKESAKRRGMKEPDIHCVYTAGVLLLAEAESTLAAERASALLDQGAMRAQDEREQKAGERCGVLYELSGCDWPDAMADALLAERASRLQADTEQFNAGIEAAAKEAERLYTAGGYFIAMGIRALMKETK